MLFRKILVPFDGSIFSHHAFRVALDIAQKYKSKITIVSFIDTYSKGWFGEALAETDTIELVHQFRQKELSNLESLGKKKGVPIKSHVIEKPSVAKPLVSFAKSNKFDLIVMGSHGRSGLEQFFLGSVSNSVIKRAPCPILVVKGTVKR